MKNVKVVQANDLITSVAKMDKIPLKIFELAVSQIDIENPPEDNSIVLSKKQLFAFFNATDGNKHTRFKEGVQTAKRKNCTLR
ncbi:replication initiation protein, partial [Kurthia huakuii]|uniref:replication initiation protein n=1 Tax=Kurthia huakuii TaxID=1421019 RepID=UPI00056D0523